MNPTKDSNLLFFSEVCAKKSIFYGTESHMDMHPVTVCKVFAICHTLSFSPSYNCPSLEGGFIELLEPESVKIDLETISKNRKK